jgi:hypothetical protein
MTISKSISDLRREFYEDPPEGGISEADHGDIDHTGITGVGGGGATILQQASEPVEPAEGDLWIDTDEVAYGSGVVLLGYAICSGNQTGIAGTRTDLSGMSKQVTVAANRLIRITAHCHPSMGGPSPTIAQFEILEGTTQLGIDRFNLDAQANGSMRTFLFDTIVVAPSAGVHTYKVALSRDAGPETLNHATAATMPSYMVIEDMGPA